MNEFIGIYLPFIVLIIILMIIVMSPYAFLWFLGMAIDSKNKKSRLIGGCGCLMVLIFGLVIFKIISLIFGFFV